MADQTPNTDPATTAASTDPVTTKLTEFGVAPEAIAAIMALGVSDVDDLSMLTEGDLTVAGMPAIQARKFLASIKPVAVTADTTPTFGNVSFDGILPSVQDDASWLTALKAGGVLKLDQSTVVAAVRAALANRVGLYEVPSTLAAAMEAFAEESEEPVDPAVFGLLNQVTRRNYAEVFSALKGFDGKYVTEKRKKELFSKLEQLLWPAINSFNSQLKAWQESWMQGAANPAALMMVMMGGQAGMPPGMMQPPDTAVLRDSADAVRDAINRVFGGFGVQISAALAYEAAEIKKSLEDPRLPSLVGVANREQMLKKLRLAVPATYPRLETNLTRYVLAVMNLGDQAAGQEELSYIGAMFMLGGQIDWSQIGAGTSSKGITGVGGSRL